MDDISGIADDIAYDPPPSVVEQTNVYQFMQQFGIETYEELIERTCGDIEWFWDEVIDYLNIEFYEPYDEVRDDSDGPQFSRWYPGGELNIAHNVVDRHARTDSGTRNHVATIWEGEDGEVREQTFHELYRETNRVASYLESVGVDTGDTVGLYMPMVPEIVPILYGCFKVGAIAVPIFSGFGAEATATRIEDAECRVLFTGDGFYRRGDEVRLKPTADEAIEAAGYVEHVVVYDRLGGDVELVDGRDVWYHTVIDEASSVYESKSLPSDAESMLLYSSGTTGRPKGIVHTHGGVLPKVAKEIYFGFDHKPHDRFFWVSDIGWMMGPWMLIGNHTFGGTVFLYEGAPDYPNPDRFWEMIDRHGLTVFGISPTAVRALREHGDEWVHKHDLSSLRLLGSTGEPWDPESWKWFFNEVGNGEAPIINISGGTEICGCFLMPLPIQALKPTTLGGPGLGMDIDIVDEDGESIVDEHRPGYLVARDSCPSMTKSLWGGDERYLEEYWSTWDDLWNHGDWAITDEDGLWYLLGRADDAMNVAGRKVGPAEVEGALIDHEAVTAAAAVGVPDETTGEAVVAYVITETGVTEDDALREELLDQVADDLGKPFRPRELLFVDEFPMTQSGKIVRRAIEAAHQDETLGDLSSIENPDAIDAIKSAR